jgi:hypothetical protein
MAAAKTPMGRRSRVAAAESSATIELDRGGGEGGPLPQLGGFLGATRRYRTETSKAIFAGNLTTPSNLPHFVMQAAWSGHIDLVSQHLQSLLVPPPIGLWQSMPSPASTPIFSMPLPCGAAEEDATGAKARAKEIEIARMVRMMPKKTNTSYLNTPVGRNG